MIQHVTLRFQNTLYAYIKEQSLWFIVSKRNLTADVFHLDWKTIDLNHVNMFADSHHMGVICPTEEV